MVTGVSQPPLTNKPFRKVSQRGIKFIHQFEGCVLTAYPDPGTGGAPWTIGWGSTTDEEGKPIKPGTVWTQERADARFAQHLIQFESEVSTAIGKNPTTQSQFDALVSFHYNTGAIARATLTQKHNNGDYIGASKEFLRWNRAGGRVMNGLTRRRRAEADMYLEGL